ncbi:MAG: Hsp70 family protein [Nitrospinae bacterium]|nr:Hsp70 family protein [Nitrospinota bacterium]
MAGQGEIIVGIDFGTTTSAIGMVRDGVPFLFKIEDNEAMLPSVVAFNKNGDPFVGGSAKKQAVLNPEKTFASVKRRLGEKESVNISGKEWSLEEMGAQIILRLKDAAEKELGAKIYNAVITVPAYFNQLQREAVQEIGKLAGLNVLRIINEPTAAAMAYGVALEEEQNVMVFDFGGGTFDVSILTIADGVFEVKASGGDNMLGGDDIDRLLMEKVAGDFMADHQIDLSKDRMAMQKLRDESEKLKITLSNQESARLHIPFITADKHGPIHIDKTFTSAVFEEAISGIISKIIRLSKDALKKSGLENKDLDRILLAGGSTRIPAVRDAITRSFGDKVAGGVNPIECVALGAAVQAAILSGTLADKVLLDITPLALGLEIDGGTMEEIIAPNTTIPVGQKKIFSTVADNQTEVEIKILQGNSFRASENALLGKFILGNIELGRKGEPKIEVEFDINVDGIMSVSAKDTKTKSVRSVRIEKGVLTRRDKPFLLSS